MNNCNITIYPEGVKGGPKQLNDITAEELCGVLDCCVKHRTLVDGTVMGYSCDSEFPLVAFNGPDVSKACDDVLISYGTFRNLLKSAKAIY